ncbi:MAG: SMC-Scp complex subunit ScpB, partial [Candidatus Aureabacteria bacterium]|nr:SMC-Scp complex subunit ScpB [Candidatus Auribacterota bacterium]
MSKNLKDPQKYDEMSEDLRLQVKAVIEAMIFASYDPLSANRIKSILQDDYDMTTTEIKKLIYKLKEEYEADSRGFEIVELGGGYHMRTRKQFFRWMEILLNKKKKETLSHAALETLSIIAYRQPVTKAKIEDIRGVNVDGIIQKIVQKGLVTILKKKDAPLVPYQYVTTNKFLEHFGLRSLADLPKLDHRLT